MFSIRKHPTPHVCFQSSATPNTTFNRVTESPLYAYDLSQLVKWAFCCVKTWLWNSCLTFFFYSFWTLKKGFYNKTECHQQTLCFNLPHDHSLFSQILPNLKIFKQTGKEKAVKPSFLWLPVVCEVQWSLIVQPHANLTGGGWGMCISSLLVGKCLTTFRNPQFPPKFRWRQVVCRWFVRVPVLSSAAYSIDRKRLRFMCAVWLTQRTGVRRRCSLLRRFLVELRWMSPPDCEALLEGSLKRRIKSRRCCNSGRR